MSSRSARAGRWLGLRKCQHQLLNENISNCCPNAAVIGFEKSNLGALAIDKTSVFASLFLAFVFALHHGDNNEILPTTQSTSVSEAGICSINTLPTATRVINAMRSPILLFVVITTHRSGELSLQRPASSLFANAR